MSTLDVIIPTLCRPEHCRNVLADLAAQTLLPTTVFVIEQDPRPGGASALADMARAAYPFALRHHYVTWVGACRARNLALAESVSEWVLFLDDDVRFSPLLLEYLMGVVQSYACDGANAAVHLPEKPLSAAASTAPPSAWPTFGTCTGLMRRAIASEAGGFNLRLEGGFGEDWEFALRCRRLGAHILYAPALPVLHLKAQVGGFRFTYPHPWLGEAVQPRPSPTILCARSAHYTPSQEQGYRLAYMLGRLRSLPPYRWLAAFQQIQAQWKTSVAWAARLRARSPATADAPVCRG